MNQLFFFTAKCPKCERACMIETYARGELLRLLELGNPIVTRCTDCHVHWPVSSEVRVRIARVLAASPSESHGELLRQRRPGLSAKTRSLL